MSKGWKTTLCIGSRKVHAANSDKRSEGGGRCKSSESKNIVGQTQKKLDHQL